MTPEPTHLPLDASAWPTLHARTDTKERCPTPTVLVYRSDILPQSETFIKEQMLAYKSWHGLLIGRRLLNQLALDGLDVQLIERDSQDHVAPIITRMTHRLRSSRAFEQLRRARPCLLHAHFGPEAISAEPIARALRLPMIVTLHGYDINVHRDWWECGTGGASMRRYPRNLLRLAARPRTHFIAVSDAVRSRAIAYGIPSDKVTTSYIGVDVSKFAPGTQPPPERAPNVLFVGRLVEKKGCEYLLRAMQVVRSRIPGAALTIIGDGPLQTELRKLAGELGGGVRFCGALPAERVKAELHAARAFCLPSVQAANGDAEGFGLVLLEAQAAGVPVVSSAFGGAMEGILHGKSGYRFEERDVEALSNCLIDLLAHPDKAAAMGLAGRQFVSSRFDIHKCTETLERHYNQLAGFSENDRQNVI